MRAKNQVSAEEAKKLDEANKIKPKEWEKRVGMLLKVNGWSAFHDVDRPTEYAKRRIAGLPDFVAYKRSGDACVLIAVECKTGKATTTRKQEQWIRAFEDVPSPCVRGLVVYPRDQPWLTDFLGGQDIVQ